jgi:hypothetical protein
MDSPQEIFFLSFLTLPYPRKKKDDKRNTKRKRKPRDSPT